MQNPTISIVAVVKNEKQNIDAFLDTIEDFADELCRNVLWSLTNKAALDSSANLTTRLAAAVKEGRLTEQQLRNNLVIIFLAGHEGPQQLLVTLMYVLGKHRVSHNIL